MQAHFEIYYSQTSNFQQILIKKKTNKNKNKGKKKKKEFSRNTEPATIFNVFVTTNNKTDHITYKEKRHMAALYNPHTS